MLGLVLLIAALKYGGGLWGPNLSIQDIAKWPEETSSDVSKKRQAYLSVGAAHAPPLQQNADSQQATRETERLQKILESWAEDRYWNTQSKVEALLKNGQVEEAKELLDKIPKEYEATSFGPKFQELKEQTWKK